MIHTRRELYKQWGLALALAGAAVSLGFCTLGMAAERHHVRHHHHRVDSNGNAMGDPRPSRWCGWWLRHELGVQDRRYNLAREWAHYGSPAGGPAHGVIAVWPHHVGIVTGVPSPHTIVLKSGNDGHAVRERERSTRGVIAYRWPNGLASQ